MIHHVSVARTISDGQKHFYDPLMSLVGLLKFSDRSLRYGFSALSRASQLDFLL